MIRTEQKHLNGWIEITAKINGKMCKLSDISVDTFKKLQEAEKQ